MLLKLGDTADDWTFLRPDGSTVRLSEWDAPMLLLIMLRHLG